MAMKLLEESYREHSQTIAWIRAYPDLDSLRSDPRFQSLIKRMGFSD